MAAPSEWVRATSRVTRSVYGDRYRPGMVFSIRRAHLDKRDSIVEDITEPAAAPTAVATAQAVPGRTTFVDVMHRQAEPGGAARLDAKTLHEAAARQDNGDVDLV